MNRSTVAAQPVNTTHVMHRRRGCATCSATSAAALCHPHHIQAAQQHAKHCSPARYSSTAARYTGAPAPTRVAYLPFFRYLSHREPDASVMAAEMLAVEKHKLNRQGMHHCSMAHVQIHAAGQTASSWPAAVHNNTSGQGVSPCDTAHGELQAGLGGLADGLLGGLSLAATRHGGCL
jgi:hypothetical protein